MTQAPWDQEASRYPYFVTLLASRRNGTLTVGVTNDLGRRAHEHKVERHVGFTATYGVDQLVWYEAYEQVDDAIGARRCRRGGVGPGSSR